MIARIAATILLLAMPCRAQWDTLHVQDFETSMAPWTHTSAEAFPMAWDRQPSSLHPAWAPPGGGGWCLWIDSDAAGNQGFIGIVDTAMSASVPIGDHATIKIKWGLGYDDYYSGMDFARMLYRWHSAGSWGGWSVGKTYTADELGWDSLVLAQAGDSIQIGFYYTDGGGWSGWMAADNISVCGLMTGVAGEPAQSGVKNVSRFTVLPNPFKYYATVSGLPEGVQMKVYDITGRLVEETNSRIIGKSLATGAYFITGKGCKPAKLIKLK